MKIFAENVSEAGDHPEVASLRKLRPFIPAFHGNKSAETTSDGYQIEIENLRAAIPTASTMILTLDASAIERQRAAKAALTQLIADEA